MSSSKSRDIKTEPIININLSISATITSLAPLHKPVIKQDVAGWGPKQYEYLADAIYNN